MEGFDELCVAVRQGEELIKLLKVLKDDLEDMKVDDMIEYVTDLNNDRRLLVMSEFNKSVEEESPVDIMCSDIDRMETVVGNIDLTVREYEQVQSYLLSMHSHIQTLIDLED